MSSITSSFARRLACSAVVGVLALPVVPAVAFAQAAGAAGAPGAGPAAGHAAHQADGDSRGPQAGRGPMGCGMGGQMGCAMGGQMGGHMGGQMGGHMGDHMAGMKGQHDGLRFLRGLDLSEQQHDRIFEIVHRQAPAMRERTKALNRTRQELGALAMSAQYDEGRAKALSDGLASVTAEMALERVRTANAVWQVLTPEQRRQVEERRARRLQPGGPQRG